MIFYYKTWNSLVNTYFTSTNLFTEYRTQKCQNAISLLKVGYILSFIVFGLPVFTNLLASIDFFDPIIRLLYVIGGIFNSTVHIIVDLVLLIAYMNLGGNLRALTVPKSAIAIQTTISDSIAPMFCPQCGNKIDPNSSFCASCGTKLEF